MQSDERDKMAGEAYQSALEHQSDQQAYPIQVPQGSTQLSDQQYPVQPYTPSAPQHVQSGQPYTPSSQQYAPAGQQYAQPAQQFVQPRQQYVQGGYVQSGYVQSGYVHVAQNRSNALGVTALVLGILALVGSWIPLINIFSLFLGVLAFCFGIAGIIFGAVKKRSKGTAIAGLVLAIVTTLLFIGSNVLALSFLDDVANLESTAIYEIGELSSIDI